ncbi:MAG: hypothetical protein JWO09_1517 [Bacteroidetes bacterium]|nr:hypothetical protein [Bacteroidota bacterium]
MGREDKHFFTFCKIINILLLKMKEKEVFFNAFCDPGLFVPIWRLLFKLTQTTPTLLKGGS